MEAAALSPMPFNIQLNIRIMRSQWYVKEGNKKTSQDLQICPDWVMKGLVGFGLLWLVNQSMNNQGGPRVVSRPLSAFLQGVFFTLGLP